MQQALVKVQPINLVGLSVRTNNKNEMDPRTAKIGGLVAEYFQNNIQDKIPHRKKAGVTLMGYGEYDSDEHGDYTYYIGEEVNNVEKIPSEFDSIVIPAGNYQKFTTPPGKIPDVVIQAWQKIWTLDSQQLGGKRKYAVDFQVHDERALDLQHAIVDIYIGIR